MGDEDEEEMLDGPFSPAGPTMGGSTSFDDTNSPPTPSGSRRPRSRKHARAE